MTPKPANRDNLLTITTVIRFEPSVVTFSWMSVGVKAFKSHDGLSVFKSQMLVVSHVVSR
jgi:hypothetical protein